MSNNVIKKKDWEIYKKDLVNVVNPVTESVNVLDKKVAELEKERKEEVGKLKESISSLLKQSTELNTTTLTLSQALKSSSVQGKWGESQLRNIVESCGMINHVDFEEQKGTQHGNDIPDMIVKLPDGGIIPVDSKCPMNDFRDSLKEDDENERIKLQKEHAKKCRQHMNVLATKKYGEQYDGPIDFVVMLIPFEPGFQAALMHDGELFNDGADKKVFIASPISLWPLLRLVDQSWRQLTLTENAAKEIQKIMQDNELAEDVCVRVGVKGGGCSGFTYTLDFDSKKSKFDLEFESQNLKILVDKKSHLYIKDTEIDWSYSLMDRGLKFNNPSAKGSCGCKTSFMFEPPEQEEDFKPSWM